MNCKKCKHNITSHTVFCITKPCNYEIDINIDSLINDDKVLSAVADKLIESGILK